MSMTLEQLIEWAREHYSNPLSEATRREAIIHFATANQELDGCDATLKDVEREYDRLYGGKTE